jgi:hypothetical protein
MADAISMVFGTVISNRDWKYVLLDMCDSRFLDALKSQLPLFLYMKSKEALIFSRQNYEWSTHLLSVIVSTCLIRHQAMVTYDITRY